MIKFTLYNIICLKVNFILKKSYILKFIVFIGLISPSFLYAQDASFMPSELIAEPGQTKTNNFSSGSSESLRVGTSSSFGANVSVSSSSGYLTEAESSVKSINGKFSSNFGGTLDNDKTISIDVGSIRSTQTENNPLSNTESISTDSLTTDFTNTAEGEATISGIFAESSLEIDPDQVTKVKITPLTNIEDSSVIETANSNAGQSLTNSLNVDITNTEFKNAFSQAF